MEKSKLVILIVDDNKRFVERMIGLLDDVSNISYINVASDYEEARKILERERPDLVLLDINLPGKSGIELLRRIKESSWNCEVIMITNHADDYYRQQCNNLGASHFLDKSSDFGMVPGIVEAFHLN